MAKKHKIIIPLCPEKLGRVEFSEKPSRAKSISVDRERKQVKIRLRPWPVPADCNRKNRVTIRIQNPALIGFNCSLWDSCIGLERDIELWDGITGDPVRMQPYPYIWLALPGHCRWMESMITAHFDPTGSGDVFAEVFPDPEQVENPEFTEKHTPDCASVRNIKEYDVLDKGVLVPGMLLRGAHSFYSGKGVKTVFCGEKYYRTCSMTGGKVTAINGTHDEIGVSYRVLSEGREVTAVPSDFVDYAVGDWVFMMSGADPCDLACDTDFQYNPEPGEQEEEGGTGNPIADFVILLNNFCSANGKNAVTMNAKLNIAAQRHCQDMVTHNFFSHQGSDGTYVQDRVEDTGYASDAEEWGSGENIAMGVSTALDVFTGWKNSPGHKANMLNGNFTEIGLSRLQRGTAYYWVNVFGYRGSAEETPGTECPVTADFVIIPLKIRGKGA